MTLLTALHVYINYYFRIDGVLSGLDRPKRRFPVVDQRYVSDVDGRHPFVEAAVLGFEAVSIDGGALEACAIEVIFEALAQGQFLKLYSQRGLWAFLDREACILCAVGLRVVELEVADGTWIVGPIIHVCFVLPHVCVLGEAWHVYNLICGII